MTNLLAVIGFWTDDAWRAEKLLDWIRQQQGGKLDACCLLCPAPDVHAELRKKISIAAEMAFATVDMAKIEPTQAISRVELINNLFRQTELCVYQSYRMPFLWLEPDCVPLKKGWLDAIADAYEAQPKRFMGPHLSVKFKDSEKPQLMLARTSVYPHDAIHDLDGYCRSASPFDRVSAPAVIPRSNKTRLIQQIVVQHNTPMEAVRKDAVLLHSDKSGRIIDLQRALKDAAKAK